MVQLIQVYVPSIQYWQLRNEPGTPSQAQTRNVTERYVLRQTVLVLEAVQSGLFADNIFTVVEENDLYHGHQGHQIAQSSRQHFGP